MELAVLKNQSASGSVKIINDKFLFSEVCLTCPMRLAENFALALFLFYPNQCRFGGGTPLGGLLAKTFDISRLLVASLN